MSVGWEVMWVGEGDAGGSKEKYMRVSVGIVTVPHQVWGPLRGVCTVHRRGRPDYIVSLKGQSL